MPPVPDAPHSAPLSGAELLVLRLLARGYSPDQIAPFLGADVGAVRDAERRACAALGVHSADEAVAATRQRGLIVWPAG